jgi:hypothetical protein
MVPGGTFIAQTTPNWAPEEIREMDTFYREDLLSRKVSIDEVFACNPTLRTTQGSNMRPLLFRFQPRHVYRSHENKLIIPSQSTSLLLSSSSFHSDWIFYKFFPN